MYLASRNLSINSPKEAKSTVLRHDVVCMMKIKYIEEPTTLEMSCEAGMCEMEIKQINGPAGVKPAKLPFTILIPPTGRVWVELGTVNKVLEKLEVQLVPETE